MSSWKEYTWRKPFKEPVKKEATDKQIGGEHYKNMKIQPSEFVFRNNLNWCQGNIIKYVCRYKEKNGKQDLDKAMHYIELLKEWEYDL